jgi:hypothetical protein
MSKERQAVADRETPTTAVVAESPAARRSGSKSRRKGKVGEREAVAVARANGHPDAERSWQTPQLDGDIGKLLGHVHLEVRRRETLHINQWAAEVEAKARNGNIPVLAYRKSGDPWRAVLPLDLLLTLIAQANATNGVGWPE